MRYFFLGLIGLFLSACHHKKVIDQSARTKDITIVSDTSYLIVKLDSIKTAFVIYAKRNNSTYKIISGKNKLLNSRDSCNVICVGGKYDLKLKSWFTQVDGMADVPMMRIDGLLMGGERITFKNEDIIHDLFYDDRLNGLCLKIFE